MVISKQHVAGRKTGADNGAVVPIKCVFSGHAYKKCSGSVCPYTLSAVLDLLHEKTSGSILRCSRYLEVCHSMKEKTKKPTPKRLRDARKKGNVSKSKEIATCATIVGLFSYFWLFFDHIMIHINRMMILPTSYYKVPFDQSYIECLKGTVKEMILISIPFALAAMVISVLAYFIQFGFIFAVEPIIPEFKKINPVEGFKRIFSLNNLLELIKSILKIVLISCIIYFVVQDNLNPLTDIPRYSVKTIFTVLTSVLKELVVYVSFTFIVFAILDYFFQKQLYLRKLKMSIDDLRQEYKEREGDPQIRRRRRKIHRDLIDENMFEKIRNAAVIITYSNKIAVAIYYKYGKTKLPIVDLKGKHILAQKMVELARRFDTPLFEDPYLARKISDTIPENHYISGEFVKPIAKLLRSLKKS
jgi:type III secretion protein U